MLLAKIDQVHGGVSIQLADGSTHVAAADPATVGELLLELLAKPQPEVVTESTGETKERASSSPPSDPSKWTPKGETLEEVAVELEEMARANVGRAARNGLGWLRGISHHGGGE